METPETLSVAGATVTLGTPAPAASEQLATSNGFVVADQRGRQIKLKRPHVLAQFRLVEGMGPAATNQAYMGMVLPMLFVVSIDGEVVVTPETKSEVEALIVRLDEDGVQAVMEGVQKHFAAPTEDSAKNG